MLLAALLPVAILTICVMTLYVMGPDGPLLNLLTLLLFSLILVGIIALSAMSPATFKCCTCGTTISNKRARKARRAWPLPCPSCGVEEHVSCPHNADITLILIFPFLLAVTAYLSSLRNYDPSRYEGFMLLFIVFQIAGWLVFSRFGVLVQTDNKLKHKAELAWLAATILVGGFALWAVLSPNPSINTDWRDTAAPAGYVKR